jgi:hypothetical protein
MTQNEEYIEQKNFGRLRAVPRLGELYRGICLTTEEMARKTINPPYTYSGTQHLLGYADWSIMEELKGWWEKYH